MPAWKFEQYGTFTGPHSLTGAYEYDSVSLEKTWHTDLPVDTSFKLTDVGVIFFNTEADYMGYHLYGSVTALAVLEKSTGPLPNLIANVTNSTFNGNAFVNGNIVTNGTITANGNILTNGVITANGAIKENGISGPTISALNTAINSKKGFDIPHPTKEDSRLRYICLEGPSAEVYFRGTLKDSNYIQLPEYWRNLVDLETIGVTLTPIGVYQELFVEKIEWGSRITVKNNLGGPINCSFTVFAERKDTQKNIPEYKGLTPNDYPGDNSEYNINGM